MILDGPAKAEEPCDAWGEMRRLAPGTFMILPPKACCRGPESDSRYEEPQFINNLLVISHFTTYKDPGRSPQVDFTNIYDLLHSLG